MICPYCNSQDVAFDFEKGYTVCRNCGTVIESIFIEQFIGVASSDEWEYSKPTTREALNLKRSSQYASKLRRLNKEIRLYEKYLSRARNNDIRVDLHALRTVLAGGKARVYRHVSDQNLEKIVEGDHLLKRILEIIDEDPILSSRTFRSKVAIALILKNIILYGEADINKIAKEASISRIHMHRLVATLKNRIKYIKPKLLELKQSTSLNRLISIA